MQKEYKYWLYFAFLSTIFLILGMWYIFSNIKSHQIATCNTFTKNINLYKNSENPKEKQKYEDSLFFYEKYCDDIK